MPQTPVQCIALHGFTGCGDDFAALREAVGRSDAIRWTCPDLPGHGPQPALDCSPEAMVRCIETVAGARAEPRILLGYSMGARASLLHNVRTLGAWDALILISANPGIEEEAERLARRASDEALARRIETEGVPAFLQFWQDQPLIRSQQKIRPDWREAMQANRLRHTPAGLAACLRGFGPAACPDLWPRLSSISCPTLLLCGAEDSKYRRIAERMAGTLPKCSLTVISDAGHAPHLEEPEAVGQVIGQFLDATF